MFEISDFRSTKGGTCRCSESKSVDQLCSDLIYTYAKDRLSCGVARMSHVTRKPVFGVSDQVRQKLDCTVTVDG